MVLVRRRVRDRRCRVLCVPPLGAPRPLVLGEPRYPPFEPALYSVDRTSADVDRLSQPVVHLPAAAVPDRLSAAAVVLRRTVQPAIPILDSLRSEDAPVGKEWVSPV